MPTTLNNLPKTLVVLITEISIEGNVLQVFLSDGREIRAPLEWFTKLRDASPKERGNWRLIGKGIGVHWPEFG
jgi:Protein of unknown function (DUF2442)